MLEINNGKDPQQAAKDWIKENQELVESWKNKRQTRNKWSFQNWIKYPNLEAPCSSLSFVYKKRMRSSSSKRSKTPTNYYEFMGASQRDRS